ncbi:MAG TPA: LysR substrate-binding domain-containing protein [Gemmatimonadaceae bacterium]|nr:LysR substrate-binding domain-containing protein [Gemmatimonadaceae bacterium]
MESFHDHTRIDMRHIRLIAAIAEHGSVTAAARVLRLSQPALSHQLRELETRLRTPLFVRTSRRMVATAAGEQLAHVARLVLKEVHGFERQAADGRFGHARGTIRLATECYTVYHWLPSVLRLFAARWPGVDLRIVPEHTASPIAALRDGSLDVAVVHSRPTDKRITGEALFDDEMVAVVSPQHRFARQPFVAAADFASEHLICYTTASGPSMFMREILIPADVVPERTTQLQLTEAILELVAADMGVAVLSKWAVMPRVRSGNVAAVRLTERGFLTKWYVATRADDPAVTYQRDLIDLLRRNMSGGPVISDSQRIA